MHYLHLSTNEIVTHRPNPLIHPDGRMTPNPTEAQYELYYSKPFELPETPAGMIRIEDSRSIQYDPESNTASVSYEYEPLADYQARMEAEEAQHLAAYEQARAEAFARLVAKAGDAVKALALNLAVFGITLPVNSTEATQAIIVRLASGEATTEEKQSAPIIAGCYNLLREQGVSDDMIAAVWESMQ
jgi:hypothetical protein